MGNILGSCCFNVAIISLLTQIKPKQNPPQVEGSPAHMLSSGFGVCMISCVLLMIAMVEHVGVNSSAANVTEWSFAAMVAAAGRRKEASCAS